MSKTAGLNLSWTPTYNLSGTITAGGTAQLLLPRMQNRYYLFIANTSNDKLACGIGAPTATAVLSGTGVASVAVGNVGMGYSFAPLVRFFGGTPVQVTGGGTGASGGLGFPSPGGANLAQAHCVMTGSAPNQTISSIVVDNAGATYTAAPFVYLENDPRDPNGCFAPSASAGWAMASGGSRTWENVACTTDAVSIWGPTTGQSFYCEVYAQQ